MRLMNRSSLANLNRPAPVSSQRGWRWPAASVLCFALSACGGGGGGAIGDQPALLGLVKVKVSDRFGAAVAGATVLGPRGTYATDAQGTALVPINSPDGTAGVTVIRSSFVDKTISATSSMGQVNEVAVTLDRTTSPAGGSLTSRSGVLPTVDATGQTMTFEIELIAVDGDSRPIENLSSADFVLRTCTPNPSNDRVDCVRGASAAADAPYAPTGATPDALLPIAGHAATPFAAALLLDQSGSILQTDPTGARLFSAKAFLSGLGADDAALLAAFAGGPGAIIPTAPLTVYGPFRGQALATSYFPTLDLLGPLLGGNTPLYSSLDALRQRLSGEVSMPAGLAKAIVIFTDGADTSCAGVEACRTSRLQVIRGANQDQVRLFTIGLTSGVDIVALGELANQTGGAMLYADTAEQLLPLYGSVGQLLSLSLPTYRLRWTVRASAPGVFLPGYTLLGRVQLTAGAKTFDVPFIVGIP